MLVLRPVVRDWHLVARDSEHVDSVAEKSFTQRNEVLRIDVTTLTPPQPLSLDCYQDPERSTLTLGAQGMMTLARYI